METTVGKRATKQRKERTISRGKATARAFTVQVATSSCGRWRGPTWQGPLLFSVTGLRHCFLLFVFDCLASPRGFHYHLGSWSVMAKPLPTHDALILFFLHLQDLLAPTWLLHSFFVYVSPKSALPPAHHRSCRAFCFSVSDSCIRLQLQTFNWESSLFFLSHLLHLIYTKVFINTWNICSLLFISTAIWLGTRILWYNRAHWVRSWYNPMRKWYSDSIS